MIPSNNKYGYKVMYQKPDNKLKIKLVTNSYQLALWELEEYIKKLKLIKTWYLYPIKDLEEYEKLWEGCPFKDDLS